MASDVPTDTAELHHLPFRHICELPVVGHQMQRVQRDFPSPASVRDPFDTPSLISPVDSTIRPSATNDARPLSPNPAPLSPLKLSLDRSCLSPVTAAVTCPPLARFPPSLIDNYALVRSEMNLIVGGALAPMHNMPPSPPEPPKTSPGLRLPSFEALGIAAPHPDRPVHAPADPISSLAPAIDTADHVTASHTQSSSATVSPSNLYSRESTSNLPERRALNAVQSARHPYGTTLTPPADSTHIQWAPLAGTLSDTLDTPEAQPGRNLHQDGHAAFGRNQGSGVQQALRLEEKADNPTDDPRQLISGAVAALLHNLRSTSVVSNPLRVLSHALPSPSSIGHAYPHVISAIHDSTPTSPTVWINVFHAIPGRFNLADLPTSPPTTPGPAIGGEDYFTQKIFDSAVPITDYLEDTSSMPRSPRPVVPPSSINISVVERYVPPTSPNEFVGMFEPNGNSLLVDRLVELSPEYGSLVFIYPTRTGAQTFMREYLSPVLDPVLRSMVVVNGLSADLSRSVGSMSAVDRLLEHHELERQIRLLCSNLSQRHASGPTPGNSAQYELMYSAKKEVLLPREAWAKDWWTKQEKPRVRDVVTRYAQEAQQKSSNSHMDRLATPAELMQQLLDGVTRRAYEKDQGPETGVEVGVFVIRRVRSGRG